MGQDARPGGQVLEAEPGEEASLGADSPAARDLVDLLVDVDAGAGFLAQRAVHSPPGEHAGRSTIPVVRFFAGLDLGQVEPNRVQGMARQQGALHVGTDHVVGRASDQVHVADRFWVISKRAKGSNLWHPCSLAAE